MEKDIILHYKVEVNEVVAADEIIHGLMQGALFIPIKRPNNFYYCFSLLRIDEETIKYYVFPRECRVSYFIKGHNPELYAKMKFHDA